MTIKEIRLISGLTQKEFSKKYNISRRNIENWESGSNKCPDYVTELLEFKVKADAKGEKNMGNTIYWTGTNAERNFRWKEEADSFPELYRKLVEKGVITVLDSDPLIDEILEKYGKTEDDTEFLDSDGDLDYQKVQEFAKEHDLTDEEYWLLIVRQNGDAYYQTFERAEGNGFVEIGGSDFENGKYRN